MNKFTLLLYAFYVLYTLLYRSLKLAVVVVVIYFNYTSLTIYNINFVLEEAFHNCISANRTIRRKKKQNKNRTNK